MDIKLQKRLYGNQVPCDGPKSLNTQAERLLDKFGGALRLHNILMLLGFPRTPSSIYKWTWTKEKGGTGGLVPTRAWPEIHRAARYEGIVITPEDMDPRPLWISTKRDE